MEHIVQFAIGIDDKAIQNRIEEYAYMYAAPASSPKTPWTVFSRTPTCIRGKTCGRP